MLTKLKDLCSTFPKVAIKQSPLDNVAAELFKPYINLRYIHSVLSPEERYGIPIDHALLRHHNDLVPDFKKYGPNEQYLINKILFSPSYLLYIIGGIGVGKTRFSHFLMKQVLPQIVSEDNVAGEFGPCAIYYDFLDEGNTLPSHLDSKSIKEAFMNSFCDRIEAQINTSGIFDLEHEIGTIWDSMIKENQSNYRMFTALSFIISRLRIHDAEHHHLVDDYARTIQKRKEIRIRIHENPELRISYLALLLRYIRKQYFGSNPACLLIIVDNVDREPSLVQLQVKLILKPFARVYGGEQS